MHWEQKREVIKMEADKEMLNRLLNEIQELIKENENEDGTYRKEYWTDNIVSTRVFNNDKLYWVPVPRWELNKSKLIDAAPYE